MTDDKIALRALLEKGSDMTFCARRRALWLPGGRSRLHGHRAAAIYSLIETAKLHGVGPEAYLGDVIARIADHPR